MGFWAAALPYIIQGGAQLASSGLDLFGTKQSAEAAKRNTDVQINWDKEKFNRQLEQENSAHQREVADLEAAGLNPILSAGSQGAGTAQGAASIVPQMPDTSGYSRAGDRLSAAIESILKIKNLDKENDILGAQEENINADTEKKRKETEESESKIKLNKHQSKLLDARISEKTSNILRNKVLNSKDKAEIGKISHEITQIDSMVDLNKTIMELNSAKKELMKDLEVLTIAKAHQTTETTKGIMMDNKIKSVKTKLRYVDAVLERCNTVLDMGVKTADMFNKGTGSIKNLSEAAGNIIPIKQGLEAISNASKVLDNY